MGPRDAGRPGLSAEVAVVGAGAAGLATAIFTRRTNPALDVLLLDGAARPGAKILVSGGSRCNVTNSVVDERDFWGGTPATIRRVLRALPGPETVAFFARIGVRLHEEEDGKLFPDTNRARDVLDALLREAGACGVRLAAGTRVTAIEPCTGGFLLETARDPIDSRIVVIATGGQSLPKSGSDGAGFEFARRLGHTIVPTTPALVPLVLGGSAGTFHKDLSGVSHEAEIAVRVDRAVALRLRGSLLWTHFGVSGPVVLNASRHWLRARLEGREAVLSVNFLPGERFESADARWTALAASRPRTLLHTTLAGLLPASVADALFARAGVDRTRVLAQLTRDERRRLVHSLTDWTLDVVDSRGYNYAEATAGGVALDEIDPKTMESRRCQGAFFVGEVLDVDGRIGGFNFQWAWSSARAAADAIARHAP